jgi:hypothetical protein
MSPKNKGIFSNFYPLGLLCCVLAFSGLKWQHMTPYRFGLVAVIVLAAFLGDIGFFGSFRLGFISSVILGADVAFSFSRWTGPHLPLDLSGAFMLGFVVALGWLRLWFLKKEKGMPEGFLDD